VSLHLLQQHRGRFVRDLPSRHLRECERKKKKKKKEKKKWILSHFIRIPFFQETLKESIASQLLQHFVQQHRDRFMRYQPSRHASECEKKEKKRKEKKKKRKNKRKQKKKRKKKKRNGYSPISSGYPVSKTSERKRRLAAVAALSSAASRSIRARSAFTTRARMRKNKI
jgi:hypothetical protein